MALRLYTNVVSLRAQRTLSKTTNALAKNVERLSSGLRINQAGDDPAGSALSSKLSADTRSLKQAARNTNNAISVVQTAEGALEEVNSLLARMRELAVQSSSSGTMTSSERAAVDLEFQLLESEIDRIVGVTEFDGQNLIDGSLSAGVDFQVGMNNSAHDRVALSVVGTGSTALGLNDEVLTAQTSAQAAITALDSAIASIASSRGTLGATQNRLATTLSNVTVMYENLSAANSRITDVDVAEESAAMTRNQIMMQAGIAVLAQSNQLSQSSLAQII